MKRIIDKTLVVLIVLISVGTVEGALSDAEIDSLAQRFRPYIKTTLDDGHEEPHHPCNWQWFVGHASMVADYDPHTGCAGQGIDDVWPDGVVVRTAAELINTPSALIEMPQSDVRPKNGAIEHRYALHLDTVDAKGGEDWNVVKTSGHGMYAHVEEVPETNGRIVNIEYSILWAYNSALCNHHHGDITTITVVYDRGCDLLTRVTYVIHGKVIETFRIAKPEHVNLTAFNNGDKCARLNISAGDEYQDGPYWHSPSEPWLLLAQDAESLLYDHPVVYAEHGSHELWPNYSGSVTAAPGHSGDGFSFLPNTVQVLGTLSSPRAGHEPFLFYNGKFGTDPMGIVFHGTWFWPEGRGSNRFGITEDRLTDRSPYEQHGRLSWPPRVEFSGDKAIVYVSTRSSPSFNGSQSAPFPDLMLAHSLVPSGGTISMAAGAYAGHAILSRACTVVASGGTVKVGP